MCKVYNLYQLEYISPCVLITGARGETKILHVLLYYIFVCEEPASDTFTYVEGAIGDIRLHLSRKLT